MLIPLSAPQTLQLARAALKSGRGAGLPELLKLIETLSADLGKTTISEIAELIEKDPAVLGRLLCVANTLVHNPNVAPMTSIPHAIHQLGFQRVRSLALSLMLVENTGGAGNPPEQREATAKALCAGLLAHGCAHSLGSVDPELAFACAALRQFGHIILPVVSLEHYREVPELMKTKSEDAAYSEMFGLTPLELSRHLLGATKLPAEVLESLNECNPATMSLTMASTYSARIVGVADFSCRLASLAMNGAHNAARFDALSHELAREFETLLPGVGTSLDAIMLHTEERIGNYTRSEGSASLTTPSLQRIRARVMRKSVDAATPTPEPAQTAATATVPADSALTSVDPTVAAPVGTEKWVSPITAIPTAAKPAAKPNIVTPLVLPAATLASDPAVPPGAETAAATGNWTEQLAQTKAFETQAVTPPPEVDCWSATLTFVRDSYSAQDSWLFVAPPGGASYVIKHGIGDSWQDFRARAAVRADERTVFGICLARLENVVIHDTSEPTLAPYLPAWFKQNKAAPGAFVLMPLQTNGRIQGLVLIGWTLPHRITVTAAQTEIARQLFATANANASKSASYRAA
jgi:HD-like signal output (HDOD) protein